VRLKTTCALTGAVAAVMLPVGCRTYERDPLQPDAHRQAWLERSPTSEPVLAFARRLYGEDAAAPAFDPAFVVPGARGADALPLVWFGFYETPAEAPVLPAPDPVVPGPWRPGVERAAYEAAFAEVQEAIGRGDTYQTNLTLPLTATWDDGGSDLSPYERLLAAQGRAFGAYLDLGRRHVLVADPYHLNPTAEHSYEVSVARAIGSILLGVVTYDANLLLIEPARAEPAGAAPDPGTP